MSSSHSRNVLAVRTAVLSVAAALVAPAMSAADLLPVTPVALEGQTAPGTSLVFGGFGATELAINNAGQVVFYALDMTGAGSSILDNDALYTWSGGNLSLIVRRGDEAPGIFPEVYMGPTTGGTWLGGETGKIGGDGSVAFHAILSGGGTRDRGIFFHSGGSLNLIAFEGDTISAASAGAANGWRWGEFGTTPYTAVHGGRSYFYANGLTDSTSAPKGAGLFSASNSGDVTPLLLTQNAINIGSGTARLNALELAQAWPLVIGNNGSVLIKGLLEDGTGSDAGDPVTDATDAVLLLLNPGGSPTVVARENTATPISGNVLFGDAATPTASNNPFLGTEPYSIAPTTNRLAFVSRLRPAAGAPANTVITSSSDPRRNERAIFVNDNTGVLRTLVREDDIAVDSASSPKLGPVPSGSVTWRFGNTFSELVTLDSGWTAFSNDMRGSASTSAATSSIWLGRVTTTAGSPAKELTPVVSEGGTVSQARMRIPRNSGSRTALTRWSDVGSFWMNNNGKIVFNATPNSGTSTTGGDVGFYYYDPELDRVFKLATLGDTVNVGGTEKVIASFPTSGAAGTATNGDNTAFNDQQQFVFHARFADGQDGVFVIDADDYVRTGISIWNQTGSGTWSPDANWLDVSPNGAGSVAEFTNKIQTASTITLDGNRTVGQVFFENATNAYTLAGGGTLVMDDLGGVANIGVVSGNHTISAPVQLADDTTVILDQSSDANVPHSLTISGAVSGAGDLVKGGPGLLKLTNTSNTYAGETRIASGVLEISGAGSLGAGNVVIDGGVLRFGYAGTLSKAIVATDTTRDLSSNVALLGGVDVGTNDVTLDGPLSFQNLSFSAGDDAYVYKYGTGKLTLAGTGGWGGMRITAGAVEVTTGMTFGSADIDVDAGGAFSVASGATFTSSGELELAGAKAATTNPPAPAVPGAVAVINGTALFGGVDADASSIGSGASLTVNGTLTTRANLNASGSSAFNDGSMSVSGEVTVNGGGTLNIGHELTVFRAVSVAAQGTLSAGEVSVGSSSSTSSSLLSVAGNLVIEPKQVNSTGTSSNPLMSNGLLTVTSGDVGANLGGVRIATGGSVAASGLRLQDKGYLRVDGTASATGQLSADADGNSDATVADLNGPVTVGSILMNVDAGNVHGPASGFTARNTINVAGSLTSSGDLTIQSNRGSDTFVAGTSTNLTGGSTLNIATGGQATVSNILVRHNERYAGANQTVTNINVNGTLNARRIQQQSLFGGTLTTAGDTATWGTPTPELTIGTLNVSIGGTVALASSANGGGTSVLRKLPTFTGSGEWDLNDNSLAVNFVAGDTDQAAAVRTALINGYAAGEWNGSGLTSLAAFNDPSNRSALGYALATEVGDLDFSSTPTATWRGVTLDATSVLVMYTLYGDTDLDGGVAFDDLGRLLNNYNQPTARWSAGDFNYDGTVGFADLGLLLNSYNQSVGGTITSTSLDGQAVALLQEHGFNVVPEPASLAGVAMAAAAMLGRRRRAS